MFGHGFSALRAASLTTALLALSVLSPSAMAARAPSGYHGRSSGYHGSYGAYHSGFGGYATYRGGYGGYYGYGKGYYGYGRGYYGYGYGPGLGLGLGLYAAPYAYDYSSAYYSPPSVIVASPGPAPAETAVASPGPVPAETAGVPAPVPPPTADDGLAMVQVIVPADATVWFNGQLTTTGGEQRVYASPALTPGLDYHYVIHARWTDGGRVVNQTRTIVVRAGAHVGVDFTRPEPLPTPAPLPVPK